MQIVNLNPVIVDATAGGTFVLTVAEAYDLTTRGMVDFTINPTVDVVLVDNQGIAAVIPGTAANSPFVCPANIATTIPHRSGSIKALSTGAAATVRRGARCSP